MRKVAELKTLFKANLPAGTLQVTLFVPSKDRHGHLIAQDRWVRDALRLLGTLFRGATAFPPGRGVWRDDTNHGRLLEEVSVIITTYTNPADHILGNLRTLSAFLHRFGRDAHQGEVGIVIGGHYFGISEYQEPEEERGHRSR